MEVLPPARELLVTSAKPITNPKFAKLLTELRFGDAKIYSDKFPEIQSLQKPFTDWYDIPRLDNQGFHFNLTNGITQSIIDFLLANRNRRITFFRGEYPFLRHLCESLQMDWSFADDTTLSQNDALVLSSPFSGTGGHHEKDEECVCEADKKGIPVMLDGALHGLGASLNWKLCTYSSVKKVAFSLSKTLDMGHFRVGFEFQRTDDPGHIQILNNWRYVQRYGVYCGLHLMEHIDLKNLIQTYRKLQQVTCSTYQISASDSVIFATGQDGWEKYSRDGIANRICLSLDIERYLNAYFS